MPPPIKRRKTSQVEEVSFDFDARADYLTGFQKRKQQRIKKAKAENVEKDRLQRIEDRKQVSMIISIGSDAGSDVWYSCVNNGKLSWRTMFKR
jgi:hypothetical protein